MANYDSALRALGDNLKRIRRQFSISQEQLAERCGLHRTYVGAVERGERNPSLTSLLRLSHGLGIPLSELVYGVDQ
ncbi:transcriptional regulator [Arthrobacter crystallopoietes]|nr:transcriptional regulator [Arthrobacter crystallopoietes]